MKQAVCKVLKRFQCEMYLVAFVVTSVFTKLMIYKGHFLENVHNCKLSPFKLNRSVELLNSPLTYLSIKII